MSTISAAVRNAKRDGARADDVENAALGSDSGRQRPGNPVAEWRLIMAIVRMDHVGVVVEDLESAKAFFGALGMELEGEASIEGPWVDQVNAIDGVRVDIAMLRTPDGHSRLELTRFHHPVAFSTGEADAPNMLGLRNIMFAVDDIDATVAVLQAHGGELIGVVAQFESTYRLCYVRGPERIIVALAEQLHGIPPRSEHAVAVVGDA